MSGSQTPVEFNFIVNIECDELDKLDPSEIKDVTFDDSNTVKVNLRNRLSRIVLESFESVGSIHLKKESFNTSNERLTSTHRSIHFGGSSGKGTGVGDYLIRFRFSVISFVDHKPGMKPGGMEIWKKMRDKLEGRSIYVDETGGVTGTIRVDDLSDQSWWDESEVNKSEDRSFPQTSEIDKSVDASFEKAMDDDSVGLPFSVDGEGEVDEEDPLKRYDAMDAVSDVQDRYERYENDSVRVRKPTEAEIEQITSTVYQQVERIIESDEPVYLDEIPDNWRNATCSRCDNSTDSVLLKFRKENRRVIRRRLEDDFGYGSESDFTDSKVTNFFVSENSELLVRPEEIVGWVISISNETRPYCEVCNSEVGGDENHSDFIETKVKSTENKRKSGDVSVDEYVNQESPMLDYERLEIEMDDGIDEGWSEYRSPTVTEAKRIEESIVRHLWRLGTRSGDENPEFNSVYDTLFGRDYDQDFGMLGNHECDVCGSPVSSRDGENQVLRDFEKHHIEPASSNKVPIIAQEVKELIDRSENAGSESSPIKVSKDGSRFLFTDEFLSLVEILYQNVDTIALFCDNCEEEVEEKHSTVGEIMDEDTRDEDETEDRESVLDYSFGVEAGKPINFLCPICGNRKREEDIHLADVVSGRCIQSSGGKNEAVPVMSDIYMVEDVSVGICLEHKREIQGSLEEFDLEGSTRREILKDLLEQLFYSS